MKNLIQSSVLVVMLSSINSVSLAAVDNNQYDTGPRCTPYPECLMTVNDNNKPAQDSALDVSDIYRFDKMLQQ